MIDMIYRLTNGGYVVTSLVDGVEFLDHEGYNYHPPFYSLSYWTSNGVR